MILTEGNIKFDFSGAISARKFDDNDHGLSHCMKAVDFIVETGNKLLFIEVKNPIGTGSPINPPSEFMSRLENDDIYHANFVPKCRDTFIYEYSFGRINKPITYIILINLENLTAADLLHQTDKLKRFLPLDGPPNNNWSNQFVNNCMIVTIAQWETNLSSFPISIV